MKLADLKRLTKIWQERLKLLDWDVKVRWLTKEEITTDPRWGWAEFKAFEKNGVIALANPADYDLLKDVESHQAQTRDVEVFIIHELSHLHFAPFATGEGTAEEIAEENIVNLYSRLLIAIDRRNDEITGRKFSKRASLNLKQEKTKKEAKIVTTEEVQERIKEQTEDQV